MNPDIGCRLVLNNRTSTDISDKDMCGFFHQHLKYNKFRRAQTKAGKSIFHLSFQKEKDTYFAFRAAKALKGISLARYLPANPIETEPEFHPNPPSNTIASCRYAFRKHLSKFHNEVLKYFLYEYQTLYLLI